MLEGTWECWMELSRAIYRQKGVKGDGEEEEKCH